MSDKDQTRTVMESVMINPGDDGDGISDEEENENGTDQVIQMRPGWRK